MNRGPLLNGETIYLLSPKPNMVGDLPLEIASAVPDMSFCFPAGSKFKKMEGCGNTYLSYKPSSVAHFDHALDQGQR